MLKIMSAFIFSILFSISTAYAEPGTPRERVEMSSAKIIELLTQDDFHNLETKPQVLEELEAEVMALFDFEEFSVRTIGPRWRQFSKEQKIAFENAFTSLLRNSYIDTLDTYSGQTLEYVGEISSKDKKRVEVRTLFKNGDAKYPVAFRMILKNDEWVVYDVIVEGISMIKNYRAQFRDILASSSIDELIKRVQDKSIAKKEKMRSN